MSVIVENYTPYMHYVNLHDFENLLPAGRYYYFNINPGTEFMIKKSRHSADNVSGTDKILLLDNTLEGFSHNIPYIYEEFVIKKNLPENQIFLMSGSVDIQQLVEETAKRLNRKPIQSKWVLFWPYSLMNDVRHQRRHLLDIAFLEEKYRNRIVNHKKVYINLNRRWRMHRISMTATLAYKNLLNKGYVSLNEADDGFTVNNFNYSHLLAEHEQHKESYDILRLQESNIQSFTNLSVDKESLIENEAHLSDSIEPYYWDSVINLTSETNFYTSMKSLEYNRTIINEPTRFLSEKTFKPMLYVQPFIMISVPKTLELLRSMGFKTFHPYIDERYDDELDDCKRLMLIAQEVEKFCNYSKSELANFLELVKDRCLHNAYQLDTITKKL
jgi:hypothetical protein